MNLRALNRGILPGSMSDRTKAVDSFRRVRLFSKAHPDAVVIPGHDPFTWDDVERSLGGQLMEARRGIGRRNDVPA